MPKYNSVNNIKAHIFFTILHEKDFDLLEPIEGEEGLEEVFSAIYDDYFIKTNNPRSKRFLELQQEIYFMNYKIQSVVQIIDFLMFNTTTLEIRKTLLESLISIGINISLENEFVEEVQNILNIELGILQNDLSFLQIEMKNMQSENTEGVFDFYESLVGLEGIHERSLDDEMVLIKYINYEKLEIKKAELQKKQNKKYNT